MNPAQLLAHFERIAEAPDAVPRLRRFILDLAVRGKLVEQDPEDEPASRLLQRMQAEKETLIKLGEIKRPPPNKTRAEAESSFDLPLGWAFTTIQDVCLSVADGDHQPPPQSEDGIPFLVIGNVRSRSIDFTGCRYVPRAYFDSLDSTRRPAKSDLLYTLVGSYGIPVLIRNDSPFCVQRHIGILRPLHDLNVAFLTRALESGWVFDQATSCATGIAQKTFPLAGLRSIRIPLPPLAEQHRIVTKVDELMALCDALEAQLTTTATTSRQFLEATLHEALAQ
jgi:type I restriction enzyme S subunit